MTSAPVARVALLASVAVLAGLLMGLLGCGDGEQAIGPGPGPQPTAGTGTVLGKVVDASQPSVGISGAQVSFGSRDVISTQADGTFQLTNIAAGRIRLVVSLPTSAAYREAIIDIDLPAGATISITISLVPTTATEPASIVVSPPSLTLQKNVTSTFTATILDAKGSSVSLQPTWTTSGGIGTVSERGAFTATAVGAGTVSATIGLVRGTAGVTVTGVAPPEISSFTLSPTALQPQGGNLLITGVVQAGAGVATVVAEVLRPAGQTASVAMLLTAGDSTNGSYEGTYVVPPNSSQIGLSGAQSAQSYSVRVTATDKSGASATTDYKTITVFGVDAPPGTPQLP